MAEEVPLYEYVEAVARLDEQLKALDRLYTEGHAALKELIEARHDAAQTAVTLALDNQHELSEKHNDLIRAGERKEETYATKDELGRLEAWQSKVTGGLIVLMVG